MRGQRVSVLRRRTDGLRTLDIEVGFTQHAGGFEGGHRIAAQGITVFRADLHGDFDGRELLVFIGHDADVGHVADVHAAEPYGSALTQSFAHYRSKTSE